MCTNKHGVHLFSVKMVWNHLSPNQGGELKPYPLEKRDGTKRSPISIPSYSSPHVTLLLPHVFPSHFSKLYLPKSHSLYLIPLYNLSSMVKMAHKVPCLTTSLGFYIFLWSARAYKMLKPLNLFSSYTVIFSLTCTPQLQKLRHKAVTPFLRQNK